MRNHLKTLGAMALTAALTLPGAFAAGETDIASTITTELTAMKVTAGAILAVAILVPVAFKVFNIGKRGLKSA